MIKAASVGLGWWSDELAKSIQGKSKKIKISLDKFKQIDNETKKIESVMIGKLEIPSLGSIGVETSLNKKKGLSLWSDFTANDAIKYLNLFKKYSILLQFYVYYN